MPQTRIDKLGSIGVIADRKPYALDRRAWSDANNVVFSGDYVEARNGYDILSGVTGTRYGLFHAYSDDVNYWFFPSLTAIHEWNGTVLADRTRASGAYTGTATDRWNGTILHGIPVLNNGVDSPQFLANPGAGAFTDMIWDGATTWTVQGNTAKVIRSHLSFLFALDTQEGATRDPQVLRWSNPADPGSMPDSWDDTAAGNLANKMVLSDTPGQLVDCLPLGWDLLVYKNDGIYILSYTRDSFVFSKRLLTTGWGLISQSAVCDIGGAHVGVSAEDVFITNGQTTQSIADDVVRNKIFSEISDDGQLQTSVAFNRDLSEVWIAYATGAATWPNKFAIWNTRTRQWAFADAPTDLKAMATGVDVSSGIGTWDTLPYATWEDWTGTWADRDFNQYAQKMFCVATGGYIRLNSGNEYGAAAADCYVERTGLRFGPAGSLSMLQRIYPDMTAGAAVNFYVACQSHPNDSVVWNGPYSFTAGTDRHVDVRVTGELHGIRVIGSSSTNWRLDALEIEHVPVGRR